MKFLESLEYFEIFEKFESFVILEIFGKSWYFQNFCKIFEKWWNFVENFENFENVEQKEKFIFRVVWNVLKF